MDKKPVSPHTGHICDHTDPANWGTFEEAAACTEAGRADGVGFEFTQNDDLWFLDIDDALHGGQWSPLACDLLARLAGAAVEVSASGNGLHVFGSGPVPPHGCKNVAHGLELYTGGRFVALTGVHASGSASWRNDAAVAQLVADYFPPGTEQTADGWTDEPCPEWDGHTDDGELLQHAYKSKSAASAFSNRASFADLFEGREEALAAAYPDDSGTRQYDASSADAALAQHLAFWTGKDCERIQRLMMLSGLRRDKWERADYLPRTIQAACNRCTDVHKRRTAAERPQQTATARTTVDFPLSVESEMTLCNRPARLVRFNGMWLTWEKGGHYREYDEELLRAEIRANCGYNLRPTTVNASLDELKGATGVDAYGKELPDWINRPEGVPDAQGLIVCRNGVLDPDTGELFPLSDDLLTFNALPFDYDPHAPEPQRWISFMGEAFDDPEAVHELQKLFGYCLTLDTSQQKIFAIIGPKRSGKGTIARTLRQLLGPMNVAGPSFSSLGRPFGLESLIGKTLAIFPDARMGRNTDKAVVAERLLSISGEDALDVERKHKGDWHGKLGARVLILSNEVPVLGDASGALASRYVVFHMPHSFYGREDPHLSDKLTGELPGILNWALQGLRNLKAEGRIVTPPSARELIEEIDALGSPIKAFVRDCCTVCQTGDVGKDELWNAYRKWHAENGIPGHAFSKEIFSRQLKTAFPGQLREYRPRSAVQVSRPRRWTGIDLVDPTFTDLSASSVFGSGVGP
ncbi:phage/plasmid primase, P4 family [Marinobacter sp. SS8-8]|uniref:phage/plasmid primase, P4 family n=1 Tax=Marinobacter sp. SS8-8 TaxID=3050452 RepID=UPI0026DF2903|nr:phage/plasmid primase, P4 family [Marinobacter sp. SS8-8]